MQHLYIITGDFNTTISLDERRGGTKIRDPFIERLEDLMNAWRLTNIKTKWGKFTWSNKRLVPGHITSRLDRILVSSSFLNKLFLDVSNLLASDVSDHHPISLSLSPLRDLGPLPFIFSSTWIKDDGFHDVVQQAWNIFFQRSPSYIWEQKLESVKKGIKNWLATRDFNPRTEKVDHIRIIEGIQEKMEHGFITRYFLLKE